MLTINELLTKTPTRVRRRAVNPYILVKRNRIEKRSGKQWRGVYAFVRLFNEDSSGDHYDLAIENHGTKRFGDDFAWRPASQVWVHCACPYFTYYLEHVLTMYGTSEMRNVHPDYRDAPPKERNPGRRPYLCKHLFALMLFLMASKK